MPVQKRLRSHRVLASVRQQPTEHHGGSPWTRNARPQPRPPPRGPKVRLPCPLRGAEGVPSTAEKGESQVGENGKLSRRSLLTRAAVGALGARGVYGVLDQFAGPSRAYAATVARRQ